MKKILAASLSVAALMAVSASASAIGVSTEVGKHYTNVGIGFGTTTSGIALSGNWSHSSRDGDFGGLGLGYNIPVGPFMATVGAKALYVRPDDGRSGYAIPLGGGLQWSMNRYLSLYGEAYYAPSALTSGINNYKEANAGVRLKPIPLLSVDVGYRYTALNGEHGNLNNVIADGPYVGAAFNF